MSNQKDSWRLAVLASGDGTNLQALMDHCKTGDINGEIVAVVSNLKYAFSLKRAREAGIETLLFEPQKFPSRTVMCAKMAKALKDREVNLICLAGYMLKLEACMIRAFPNRIINIHPALLPKFGGKGMYGRHVHEAVIEAQEKESGCTIHVANEFFDQGPIIAQARVPVDSSDTPETLAEKIHPEEHKLYVSVVKDICSGKINLDKYASAQGVVQ
jgi:phosphoribosylglycinamide formyltransferase-1